MAVGALALIESALILCSSPLAGASGGSSSASASSGGSPWCPQYNLQHEPLLGDPSAPIRRVADGTWHLYNGRYHFSSQDLFRWRTQPFGLAFGLTGSMSFTESGYLIHRPALGGIARSVPNGTGPAGLDDFRDESCAFHDPPAVTGPGKEWHTFMDSPSRALRLPDGRYYMATAGYCCSSGVSCGANPCPQGMGIPWFVASSPALSNFSFVGYLHNVSSSLGSFVQSPNQQQVRWQKASMRNALNACPDIFPIGPPNASLYALIDSFAPSYTAEWFIGTLRPGADNYARPAFTQLARGIVDYGGMFAPKTGADDVADQRQSTRRVLFSTSEDLMQNRQGHVPGVGASGETVPGCSGMTMLMPRELGLGRRRRRQQQRKDDDKGDDSGWYLTMAPPPEVASLRGAEQHGIANPTATAQFRSVGSQIEVRVLCSSRGAATSHSEGHDDDGDDGDDDAAASAGSVRIDVLRSASGAERLTVTYDRANRTFSVDQRHANAESSAAALVQEAPYDAEGAALELRVFVDGGLVQSFLNDAVTITSLVNLSAAVSPPAARGVEVSSTGGGCRVSVWPLSL
jgi:hypothetical protein